MEIIDIRLLTGDIEATEEFYSKKLLLPVVSKEPVSITFGVGTSLLTFELFQDAKCVYHVAFNIPRNKLEEAFRWLEPRVKIQPATASSPYADFSNWNAHALYFYDNNGNILECIARHKLNNTTEAAFDQGSFLCISEMGIVCDSVVDEVSHFSSQLGLEPFTKQPVMDNFAALGDDNGLLIFVGHQRNWYPTDIPSVSHPSEIRIRHHYSIYHITIRKDGTYIIQPEA